MIHQGAMMIMPKQKVKMWLSSIGMVNFANFIGDGHDSIDIVKFEIEI